MASTGRWVPKPPYTMALQGKGELYLLQGRYLANCPPNSCLWYEESIKLFIFLRHSAFGRYPKSAELVSAEWQGNDRAVLRRPVLTVHKELENIALAQFCRGLF